MLKKTSISYFVTHVLFSRNRKWIGKEIFDSKTNIQSSENKGLANEKKEITSGCNRFFSKSTTPQTVEMEHKFDVTISPSRLDSKSSLRLKYANYQSSFSLWKSMVDELRMIDVLVDENSQTKETVLLGIGCMSWSGGIMNAAPFLMRKASGD